MTQFKRRKSLQRIGQFCLVVFFFNFSNLTFAASKTQQAKVSLFGQPCLIEGPYSPKLLLSIHSISPAEVPILQNSKEAKGVLQNLQKVQDLPKELKDYQEKIKKNVQAYSQLFSELESARAGKNGIHAQEVIERLKPFLTHSSNPEFKMRLEIYLNHPQQNTLERLLESFQTLAPERAEEEFHKAIQKINVRYICSFDDR